MARTPKGISHKINERANIAITSSVAEKVLAFDRPENLFKIGKAI